MKNEFYYNSQDGFTEIHAVEWIPETPVTGIIQICHGMAEYIDRYAEFAEYMCTQGFYVVGNDHLGHGKSVRNESYLGHFQEVKGNEFVIGDIRTLQETSLKRYPGLPYIMMGHSMGSFLLRQYLTIYGEDVSAAIIMGTGAQPPAMLKVAQIMCKIIASVKGSWKYKSKLMDKMVLGSYNKKFQPEKTGVEWLSVNEENCVRYVADPLCGFSFTLGGYGQMFAGMAYITKEDHLKKMPKEIPVLFISGAEDPVGGFSKDVKKVYKQFKDLGMKDVTIRLYPGDRHEVLKEDNREKVMDDILSWIYGSRENLADEEFPVSEALEFKAVSLDEKDLRKPVSAASIAAEFEDNEKKPAKKKKTAKKAETPKPAKVMEEKPAGPKFEIPKVDFKPDIKVPVAAQSDIKWPEVKSSGRDVREMKQKIDAAKLVSENVGAALEAPVEEAAEEEPRFRLKPITVFDMGVTKGLTPLSSVDEDGMTESDLLAAHLKSILTGEYERKLIEEEERAAEEAAARAAEEAAARLAAEEAERAARAAEELAKIAEKAKMEAEASDDEEIDELLSETEDELDKELDALPNEKEETEEVEAVEEEEAEEEEEEEEIIYASEEDALLAFIDKLDAEKIARGEPIAEYKPETADISAETGKRKPGPVLSELVMSKPITADLEEAFETEEMPVDMIDISAVGDVLGEMSEGTFNTETEDEIDDELDSLPDAEFDEEDGFGATEELEPIDDEEEVAASEVKEEEHVINYHDDEGYLMDLSSELDELEDVEDSEEADSEMADSETSDSEATDLEEADSDEEDFEEAELEEEDFDEEDFEEADFEEAELEDAVEEAELEKVVEEAELEAVVEEDFDEEDEKSFDEEDVEESFDEEDDTLFDEIEEPVEASETEESVDEAEEIEELEEIIEEETADNPHEIIFDFDDPLDDMNSSKNNTVDFDVDIFDEEKFIDDEEDTDFPGASLDLFDNDFKLDLNDDEEPTINLKK